MADATPADATVAVTPVPYKPPAVGDKRPIDADTAKPQLTPTAQPGSQAKRQQRTPGKQGSAGRPPETVYRMLVPSKHAGFIIGKAGCEIKKIREQTGARLKVVETVSGCEERPVVISSKTGDSYEDCSAQAAVISMYAKFQEAEAHTPSSSDASEVPLRILVSQTQAGCLIGKSGVFIKQLRDDSGSNVRVLRPEELPLCALANDRVVQMDGTTKAIEAALKLITKKLWENPPTQPPGGAPPALLTALGQGGGMEQQMQMQPMMSTPGAVPMMGGMSMQMFGGHMPQQYGSSPAKKGTKTIMVPSSQVGLIIGAGGSNIAKLRQNSGADIQVHKGTPGDTASLRMVDISGQPDQIAAAEAMVLAVANRNQPLPPGSAPPAASAPLMPYGSAPPLQQTPYGAMPPPGGAPYHV